MRVLFFGTYDVIAHPRVLVLREGLQQHGWEVAECNAPLGIDTAARVQMLGGPWRAWRLAVRLLRCWLSLVRLSRRVGHVDAVVVGYMGQFDVLLARALFPRTIVVLDFLVAGQETAVDRGAKPGSSKVRLLSLIDMIALRAATLALLDTPERMDVIPAPLRPRVAVARVGAPAQWFVPLPAEHPEGRLAVIFFGLFTPLQGTPTIARAVGLLADDPRITFTVVGTGQDSDEVRSLVADNPLVRWLDWVPGEDLPAAVAEHDVCLGIFGTGEKARRVVPNKVFQGAAAGCAVVTSDTGAQRSVFGDAASYVPPGDAPALADALRALVEDPQRLDHARRSAHELASRAFRPATVVKPLVERLG